MKRAMPEFLAIPVVIVLLGVVIVILLAADAGLATWIIVGGIAVAAAVIFVLVAMRRPRAPTVSDGSDVFEGGAPPAHDGVHRVLLVFDDACTTGDLQSLAVHEARTEVRLRRGTGGQLARRAPDGG